MGTLRHLLMLIGMFVLLFSCSMKRVDNEFYKILNKVSLNTDLEEVSGLTYYKNGTFLAVQDELGMIYVLDETSGNVLEEWKFGKKGDYEGITLVGTDVYILRSDGDLFKYNINSKETEKLNNPYLKNYEFEGLCYDEARRMLILSCKSAPKSKLNKKMLFYGYKIDGSKWIEDPIYTIKKSHIENVAGFEINTLKASGIVQNPINQDFYVVASLGSVIIQLGHNFNVKRVIPLHDNFNQPEGITINSNGELVISNEANKNQNATMYTIQLK